MDLWEEGGDMAQTAEPSVVEDCVSDSNQPLKEADKGKSPKPSASTRLEDFADANTDEILLAISRHYAGEPTEPAAPHSAGKRPDSIEQTASEGLTSNPEDPALAAILKKHSGATVQRAPTARPTKLGIGIQVGHSSSSRLNEEPDDPILVAISRHHSRHVVQHMTPTRPSKVGVGIPIEHSTSADHKECDEDPIALKASCIAANWNLTPAVRIGAYAVTSNGIEVARSSSVGIPKEDLVVVELEEQVESLPVAVMVSANTDTLPRAVQVDPLRMRRVVERRQTSRLLKPLLFVLGGAVNLVGIFLSLVRPHGER